MPAPKFASGKAKREEQERRRKAREEWDRQQRERDRQQREQWQRSRAHSNPGYAARLAIKQEDKAMALEIINAGHRALVRKHHPDLNRDDPQAAHEMMVKINRVIEALRLTLGS
jgi:hypothetical protein